MREASADTTRGTGPTLLAAALLAAVYYALASLGSSWGTIGYSASPIFPAAGVALAALYLGGLRLWPAVVVGRVLAYLTDGEPQPWTLVLMVSCGNALTAAAGAWGLRQFAGFNPGLVRLRDVLWFIAWGVLLASMPGATVGAITVKVHEQFEEISFAQAWITWWSGNLMGVLVTAPLILAWSVRSWSWPPVRYWLHLGACLGCAAVVTILVFATPGRDSFRTWLIFPTLIWAALVFNVRGAAAAILVVASIAVWNTSLHELSHTASSIHTANSLTLLQQFLAVASMSTLVLAVVADERRGKSVLEASEARLRFLSDLTAALHPLDDAAQIIATASTMLGRHLKVSRCAYADVEKDGETFTMYQDYCDGCQSTAGRYQLSAFGPRAAADQRAGRTLVVHDIERELPPGEGRETFLAVDVRAVICCPLIKQGNLTAMMAVHQSTPRRWSIQEIQLVEATVERCWAYIERARVNRDLQVTDERLRLGQQVALAGTFDWNIQTGVNVWSPELERLYGLAPGTFGGTLEAWEALLHPEDVAQAKQATLEAMPQGTFIAEWRIVRPDGQVRWLAARGQCFADEQGRPLRLIGANFDVTDRKEAEAALRESESRFRSLVEAGMVGVITSDAEGRVVQANDYFLNLLGYTQEDVAEGRLSWPALTPPQWMEASQQAVERLKKFGKTQAFEKAYVHKDGHHVPVLLGSARVEKTGHVVSFVLDLTERKRVEAEREALLNAERAARADAEHAGRLKDEFLATLGHELRTPLNAMLGWSQLLLGNPDLRDEETLAEGLDVIDRNARAQSQLIEDLLDMSRVLAGKLRLDPKLIDPREVVQAAVESARPAAEAKGIRLEHNLAVAAGPVRVDPDRLQQVVWNLLSNAVKFTPKGGRVRVTLHRVESQVEIAVQDTGMGIKPEFLPHLFGRFRQADASTTRRHGGLGLGLALVRQLVELQGGRVRAESAGEAMGSTFTVELPLPAVEVETGVAGEPLSIRPAREALGAQPTLGGVRVLIVDDEADARNLVRRVLEERGATVLVAADATAAFRLLQSEKPDVLVSDIGMPGMDGYQLIRMIRELPLASGGSIPAAALTAFAREDDRRRALEAGFQIHAVKPIDPARLVQTVARLVGHRV